MKDKFANLIDLKSIITIATVITFCIAFAVQDKITAEQFTPVVLMILGFYFGKTDSKKDKESIEPNSNEAQG